MPFLVFVHSPRIGIFLCYFMPVFLGLPLLRYSTLFFSLFSSFVFLCLGASTNVASTMLPLWVITPFFSSFSVNILNIFSNTSASCSLLYIIFSVFVLVFRGSLICSIIISYIAGCKRKDKNKRYYRNFSKYKNNTPFVFHATTP